jgi:hypothetical protein
MLRKGREMVPGPQGRERIGLFQAVKVEDFTVSTKKRYVGFITNLIQHFKPDILGPMRSDGSDDEGLELDISENYVSVHTDPGSTACFTIEVSRTGEVIKGRLQSKFEIRARKLIKC